MLNSNSLKSLNVLAIIRHKGFLIALALSFFTYIIFFGNFLTPDYYFFGAEGDITDAQTSSLPARTYFHEKILEDNSFPFWTEKMFSGFPIYADPENAYLNPLNDLSILLFGPKLSYKILHLLEYLIGSLGLYFLLKRKGIGLWGYVTANVVFYFSAFFINHQIHFNIIMALYPLPLALLLADLFIEKRKARYIFFQSLILANALLWGHAQSAVIMSMAIFFYMLVFSIRKIRLSHFLFYFGFLILLVVIITLPQILPTQELLKESVRSSDVDYLKGSFSPKMAIFSFVPYLFGTHDNFFGMDLKKEFTYTNLYIYFGISSLILSTLALILLRKTRIAVLAFIFIWIFLIFGFMARNKLFPDNTPIITLFREWARTAVIASLGIGILAGLLVEKLRDLSWKNIRWGFLFVLSPLIYIWILIISKGKKNVGSGKNAFYTSYEYIQSYPFFPILKGIVLSLIVAFLIFFIVRKMFPKFSLKMLTIFKIAIVGIIFFDLIYFSQDMLSLRLQDISSYEISSAPEEMEDKRVILNSVQIIGMESLYYKNWSPLGRSQLKSDEYLKYYKNELGIKLKGVPYSTLTLPKDCGKMKDAGIFAIAKNDEVEYFNNTKIDLIKNDLDGKYIKKEEGFIVMDIESLEDTVVGTYLRYDRNWRVKVDGQKVDIVKNKIFFDFPLTKGKHIVEIRYIPKTFYFSLAFSSVAGIIIGFIFYIRKKKKIMENKNR